tara:strand:- start:284 stop:475 length:192 start_codon:yes stop_codon:yes gene_type:complete
LNQGASELTFCGKNGIIGNLSEGSGSLEISRYKLIGIFVAGFFAAAAYGLPLLFLSCKSLENP